MSFDQDSTKVQFVKGYVTDAAVDIIMQTSGHIPPGFSRIPLHVKYTPKQGEVAIVVARTSTLNCGIFIPIALIDADYEGNISAWVFNTTNEDYHYNAGERLFSVVNLQLAPTRVSHNIVLTGLRGKNNDGSSGGHNV